MRSALVVVRGEPIVFRASEGLEEEPGPPRQAPQEAPVILGKRFRIFAAFAGHRPSDFRRGDPKNEQRKGCGQSVRFDGGKKRRESDRNGRSQPHLAPYDTSRSVRADVGGGVRGACPFEEVAPACKKPPERDRDRTNRQYGVIVQIDDGQKPAAGLIAQLRPQATRCPTPPSCRQSGHQIGEYLTCWHEEGEQTPEPCLPRQNKPTRDHQ